jgi:hypothetical protein
VRQVYTSLTNQQKSVILNTLDIIATYIKMKWHITLFPHDYTVMLPQLAATALIAWQNIVLPLLEGRKWQLHLTSSVGMQYFTYPMAK